MSGKLGAFTTVNAKGERVVQSVKLHRYRPGKGEKELESDEEMGDVFGSKDQKVLSKRIEKVNAKDQRIRVKEQEKSKDNQSSGLKIREAPAKDQGLKIREPSKDQGLKIREAPRQSNGLKIREESNNEGLKIREEVFIQEIKHIEKVQSDSEDEDEIEARRRRIRQRALERVKQEELELKQQHSADAVQSNRTITKLDSLKLTSKAESSEEEESEEESSEEEAPRKQLYKPVFVKKSNRGTIKTEAEIEAEYEEANARRKEELELRQKDSHEMVAEAVRREMIDNDTLLRDHTNDVDDTDGLDPVAERELWKQREFHRLRRDHGLLTSPPTPEEDETEEVAPAEKPKRAFLQKYYHRGAFFQDLEGVDKLIKRDTSAPTGDDNYHKEVLPEIMQVRNFGKMSRTKWKHLTAEDTTKRDGGSWNDDQAITQRHLKRMGGVREDDLDKYKKRK